MGETLNSDEGNTSLAFDSLDELDEILEDEDAEPTNTIITQLSDEAKLRMEVLQSLIEPCDRKTYGIKLKQAAEKLGKTVRTVQRLVKKYQEQGLSAITEPERSDRGNYRIDQEWQEFIVKTYREGNKSGRKMTPAQVAIRVQVRAEKLGLERYPSHMTGRFTGFSIQLLSAKSRSRKLEILVGVVHGCHIKPVMDKLSNLTRKETLMPLYQKTGGKIGLVDRVLRRAAILSLRKGLNNIDIATLDEVLEWFE